MTIVATLCESCEPAIRYKVRRGVLGENPENRAMKALAREIRQSSVAKSLLERRDAQGRIEPVKQPYAKWFGGHWVFAALADIGYPRGDAEIKPIADQVLDYWLRPSVTEERVWSSARGVKRSLAIPVIDGLARPHASQHGNTLYAAVTLGFADERCDRLAELLIHWQWPDGGWNCDLNATGATSSFWESITPLRGLAAYAAATRNKSARTAAKRAAEVFLSRNLFQRKGDGAVMNRQFTQLHYPLYWHYDILFGLKVLVEAGFIGDDRCADALDLLEEMRLPDAGWPANATFHRNSAKPANNVDPVRWGGVSKSRMNPWVTADALTVLTAADRKP